jgi:hypothetical protein
LGVAVFLGIFVIVEGRLLKAVQIAKLICHEFKRPTRKLASKKTLKNLPKNCELAA